MNSNSILVKHNNKIQRLSKDNIIFIETHSGRLFVHMSSEICAANGSLSDFEKELGYPFFRSHKSFIVNLHKIKYINNTGDRVYEIQFRNYARTAWLSRAKYAK